MEMRTPSGISMKMKNGEKEAQMEDAKQNEKPFFRPAKDDTKPLLQDPILRSDPIETEEAVLRLSPLPNCIKLKSRCE